MFRILILALLASSPAMADCSQIKNQDQRQFCRAAERGNSSSCAHIRDHDKRQFCKSVTR